MELRTRDRERKLLKKIDEALARITAGTYGFCKDTGDPIGISRLLARPTATLSVEAQDKREWTQWPPRRAMTTSELGITAFAILRVKTNT